MVKTKKKQVYASHWQFIHIFAQGKHTKSIRYSGSRTLRIDGKSLYYNNLKIATIYNYKRKIVIIDNNFYTIGSYGNGISYYDIVRAFSDEWSQVLVNAIPDKLTDSIIYKKGIDSIRDSIDMKYAPLARLLDEGKRNVDIYAVDTEAFKSKIDKLSKLLNGDVRYLNKQSPRVIHFTYYTGWTKNTGTYRTDVSVNHIIKNGLFSDEEKSIIDRKLWIHAWFYGEADSANYSKVDKEDIYDDIKKRNTRESRLTILREDNRLRDERIKKEEREHALSDWLKGKKINHHLYDIPIHLRVTDKGNAVETTNNAKVPISQAKQLFKFFLKIVASNNSYYRKRTYTVINHNDKDIAIVNKDMRVGDFTLRSIDKDLDGVWYVIVGCHTIKEPEINLFIDTFKPEWRNV